MNGKIIRETVGSVVLKENALGDPRLREFPVYVPPSYGSEKSRRYPVIYYLTGFTGTARGMVDAHPWKETLVARLDRLIKEKKTKEFIMVIPDCFTRYGGSQYVNSAGTGRYEDHIVSELVPYIDAKYRTQRDERFRAVMGKSSGGYGALYLGMRHSDVFGHVVSHSGDMFFEMCYAPEFPKCVNALARYGGAFRTFLRRFSESRDKFSFPNELINMAGMASCYSPNKKNPIGFDLPFDERTGELKPLVWGKWLAYDPVRMAEKHAGALKRLKTLYFDCGSKDEFFLHLGARKFSDTLKKIGVRHVYEEHGFGHFNMSERYDLSLARLGRQIKKSGA